MGIEKFFNSIKKSYGNQIIKKIEKNDYFPDKYLLIDFNSIIHNISQSISTSIVYLYHIVLTSNTYPQIFKQSKDNIDSHINNLKTSIDFILEKNIILPDVISSNSNINNDDSKYNRSQNFKSINLESIDISFFKLFDEDNLDKFIIHKVSEYVEILTNFFPDLSYLYMAIDGVPLFSKMIEQKKRRTIGHILNEAKKCILDHYKSELDVDPNISEHNDIYYNHYQFEKISSGFKFNKNKISPGTEFMSKLELYIVNHLSLTLNKKIKIVLDPYSYPGEGEKKIVYKIHELFKESDRSSQITVYSPDADMIILMLIESDKFPIQIMRYDQQLFQLDSINITELKKIIIKYMGFESFETNIQNNIINDIVMLFTILGNDFLPKLEIINTNKHIRQILNAYQKINENKNINTNINFIFNKSGINWINLKNVFINLNLELKQSSYETSKSNKYFKAREWTIKPDQIINSNALEYLQHIFNIENLVKTYDPELNQSHSSLSLDNKIINRYTIKYLQGMVWLQEYYLNHDFSYKLFNYKYKIAPTIKQLIHNIDRLIQSVSLSKKIVKNLKRTIISDSDYFKPVTQLIYISPTNILDVVDKNMLNDKLKQLANNWDLQYNTEYDIKFSNNRVNIYDYIDCHNAIYLSKCELKSDKYFSSKHILKKLS